MCPDISSLPRPAGLPALSLTPQQRKQKTFDVFIRWLLEETKKAPVYMVWEDLHWVDPSTLEFLELCVDRTPAARTLMILTFRPEFPSPWASRSYVSHLVLSRLGRLQSRALVEGVTGGKALPAEVLQQVVAKTNGVPLFVEELTKMVMESGLLREAAGHYELTGPLPPLAIPSTLQDSLMARLDRLATVREVSQLGAAIGRDFSYELLAAIAPYDDMTLQQGLTQLMKRSCSIGGDYRHGRSTPSSTSWCKTRPISHSSKANANTCTSKLLTYSWGNSPTQWRHNRSWSLITIQRRDLERTRFRTGNERVSVPCSDRPTQKRLPI